jgi:hypothetical protein
MAKMGRPAHKPTPEVRRMVNSLVARGMPRLTIAEVVGVSGKTLEKHYHHELATGADVATANVAGRLYQQCLEDSNAMPATVARIFWMKTHGWRESQVITHEGEAAVTNNISGPAVLYLPDNHRDPDLVRPMKTIEHRPAEKVTA